MQLGAGALGRLRELQTACFQPSGLWGVTVNMLSARPAGDAGHAQHQIAIGVVVAGRRTCGDRLDRSPAELSQHTRERDELVG